MTDHIIRTRDFSLYYGNKLAMQIDSLDIPRNRVISFIGPSGCGKTSFLRSINRMNDFFDYARIEGNIWLEDEPIYSSEVDVSQLRKSIAMVFQETVAFPMSIFRNVSYGLELWGYKNKKEIQEIVEKSLIEAALFDEIKDMMHQSALVLSGGQRQRLAIARVLALNPEVILMDEPTASLDPISTAKIEELLLDLKKKCTIVIVTHSMQQAARISDHTAFFYMGKLWEEGETKTIFTNPKQQLTEDYITGRFG